MRIKLKSSQTSAVKRLRKLITSYLEQQLVSWHPLYRGEQKGRESQTLAHATALASLDCLTELLRTLLIPCQRPHCHLELVHVGTVHVHKLRLWGGGSAE